MIETFRPSNQLIGAVLNARWKLVRLLGEGGMGAVYEADGLRGEGKRAIKMLHAEFAEEEQILQRFYTEGQATQSLQHPNIAAVYEAARAEDGSPYLVMELLSGTPLGTYLDNNKPLPPQQAIPLIYEVLQALSMAHARNIVHRDIKPDNLFLVRDAQGVPHVKVLDFGIAKVMDAAGGMGSKTRTGVLLGTPGYMSPEQIKNSKAVDARSDLWSVGIILYEMLTAKSPFPAENQFTRLTAVLTNEVHPIEQVTPHLSAWGPFFRRALAKDPGQRFQTAEEMANALSSMARGGSIAPPSAYDHSVSYPGSMQQGPAAIQAGQPSYAMSAAGPRASMPQGVATAISSPTPAHSMPATISGLPPPLLGTPTRVSGAPPNAALYSGSSAGPTHVSAQAPPGTPSSLSHAPAVQVIQAGAMARQGQGAPWWLVFVVGFVCLGLGFVAGMLAGR